MAALTDADAALVREACSRDYPSLRAVPTHAFPLFVTTQQYLRMLDATCDEPFFQQLPAGAVEDDEAGAIDAGDPEVSIHVVMIRS